MINKKFKYFCLTFRSPLRKPLSKTMKLKKFTVTDLRQLTDQVCCLKDGTDGVVSTASTTTSNPLPTLYCYDISGSNDRGG